MSTKQEIFVLNEKRQQSGIFTFASSGSATDTRVKEALKTQLEQRYPSREGWAWYHLTKITPTKEPRYRAISASEAIPHEF
jgi:transposase